MSPLAVSRLQALAAAQAPTPASAPEAPFADQFKAALSEANETLQGAEESAQKLAAGEVDVVETMIALGKADLSLRFVVALRNRALEAYNEIMRLQV